MKRHAILESLKQQKPFDLLIIGAGATGCGIAVDAASRGLRVALIERNDIAEGTSCRSTKLVHGGVRYLEAAVKKLDRAQYHLVKEALHERGLFLQNAPHLANPVALVTPLYKWHEVPYVYAGLRMYDLLAGDMGLGKSYVVGRDEALRKFPMLKAEGLKAGVVYYDGQFNDARMAVTLAMTAQKYGAVVATRVEAISLEKVAGKIYGARVRDRVSGEEFVITASGVINAAGPFVDQVRAMDDAGSPPVLKASSGIHIVLSKRFVPPDTGLLIPKTEDGRVLFVLPWQGHALIGTTENSSPIVEHPVPTEDEIEYVLRHINKYFDLSVKRSDVMSVWSGLRPLVQFDKSANTAQQVREHLIMISPSGLLTMAGGKWTSYRKMAEEAVGRAVSAFHLKTAGACQTKHLRLVGGENYVAEGAAALAKKFGLDEDVAYHLHRSYGDRAPEVAELAKGDLNARLHPNHPYIEAEAVYSARFEFAESASDFVTRRIPLALVDNAAAKIALPRVVALMAQEHGWDDVRCRKETEAGLNRLETAI